MLSKAKRFNLGEKENEKFFSSSRRLYSKHFILFHQKDLSQDLQVSVVISKKVSNRAVVRNRLRRQAYSIIENLPFWDNEKTKNTQIVVVSKRNINHKMDFKEMEKELITLFDIFIKKT